MHRMTNYLPADFERYTIAQELSVEAFSHFKISETTCSFPDAQLPIAQENNSSPTCRPPESSSAYTFRCRSSRRPVVFTDARAASGRTSLSCSATAAAFLRQSYNKAAERGTRPAAAAHQPHLVDAIWKATAGSVQKQMEEKAALGALKIQVMNPKPSRAASPQRQPTLTVSHLVTSPFPPQGSARALSWQ